MSKLLIGPEGFVDLRRNPPATTVTVQGFTPEPEAPRKVSVETLPEPPAEPVEKPLPAIQKTAEGLQQSVAGPVKVRLANGSVRYRKARGKEVRRITATDMPECYAIVSLNSWKRLSKHEWRGVRSGHLYRKVKNKVTGGETVIWLHRAVKHCNRDDQFVAFLDGDQRNLLPHNLRIVNTKEEVKAIRRAALGKAANG